jgi:hypothetical protein
VIEVIGTSRDGVEAIKAVWHKRQGRCAALDWFTRGL